MVDSNGNIIVYNGEIYNYKEIKSQLGLKNLKSNSDTEIILESYKFWGEECVKHFKECFLLLYGIVLIKNFSVLEIILGLSPSIITRTIIFYLFCVRTKSNLTIY